MSREKWRRWGHQQKYKRQRKQQQRWIQRKRQSTTQVKHRKAELNQQTHSNRHGRTYNRLIFRTAAMTLNKHRIRHATTSILHRRHQMYWRPKTNRWCAPLHTNWHLYCITITNVIYFSRDICQNLIISATCLSCMYLYQQFVHVLRSSIVKFKWLIYTMKYKLIKLRRKVV